MPRHAVIDSQDVIVNIIMWDGAEEWTPPVGAQHVEIIPDGVEAGIGWAWNNGAPVDLNPPTDLPPYPPWGTSR